VAGTVAMFLVGGGILSHGWPALHHLLERWIAQAAQASGAVLKQVVSLGLDAGVGLLAGALVLAAVTAFQRIKARD
jgi:uncharacterized protein